MPKKIRELKALLRKVGFSSREGKGSHTVWTHTRLKDRDDAMCYPAVMAMMRSRIKSAMSQEPCANWRR